VQFLTLQRRLKKMNEAPNNTSGLNDTFSSQPAPQTNPFTADLKGEFTSNFGTNTNAVSQIFKEGGFVNQDRTKKLIIGGVAIAVLAILLYVLWPSSGDESDSLIAEDGLDETLADEAAGEEADEIAGEDDDEYADEAMDEETTATEKMGQQDTYVNAPVSSASSNYVPSSFAASSGSITLTEPADGSSLAYDESQGAASFSWSGGGG